MSDLDKISARLREFAQQRDWDQFHTIKNLSTALVVEASELAEIYQWRTPENSSPDQLSDEDITRTKDECADVAIYLIRLCDIAGIDLLEAVEAKIERNEKRFPRVHD